MLALNDGEEEFDPIYNYIVGYESTVFNSSSLSSADWMKILTATSVFRYATYARKKKPKKSKDPEWDLLVGNFIGSVEGVAEGIQEAILRGLVCGLIENK